MFGALLGIGGSLLGGLVNKKSNEKAQAKQNAFNVSQNDPANIRAKFEAAGFNPLLGVQGWSPTQQSSFAPSGMGTAIAEAGGIAAQYLGDKAKEQSEVTRLQQQNAKLGEMLRDNALRPTVGGVFQGQDPIKPKTAGVLSAPTDFGSWFMQGEKPEREEMKNEAALKQVRFGGHDYLTPAEPDLDELLVNAAFIAAQAPSKYARQWSDRFERTVKGQLSPAEKAESRTNAVNRIGWSTNPVLFADKVGQFFGLDPKLMRHYRK